MVDARALFTGALRALESLEPTDESRRWRTDALVCLVSVSWLAMKPEQILTYMDEAEAQVASLGPARDPVADALRLARINSWRGCGHHSCGEPVRALACYRSAAPAAREQAHDWLWSTIAGAMGQALVTQGYFAEALPYLKQTQEALARAANWAEWCRVTGFAGISIAARGDCREALVEIQRTLDKAVQIRHATVQGTTRIYFMTMYLMMEEFEKIRALSAQLIDLATGSGDRRIVYVGLRFAAWAQSRLQDPRAEESLTEAARLKGELGKTILNAWWTVADAEHRLDRGDHAGPSRSRRCRSRRRRRAAESSRRGSGTASGVSPLGAGSRGVSGSRGSTK